MGTNEKRERERSERYHAPRNAETERRSLVLHTDFRPAGETALDSAPPYRQNFSRGSRRRQIAPSAPIVISSTVSPLELADVIAPGGESDEHFAYLGGRMRSGEPGFAGIRPVSAPSPSPTYRTTSENDP